MIYSVEILSHGTSAGAPGSEEHFQGLELLLRFDSFFPSKRSLLKPPHAFIKHISWSCVISLPFFSRDQTPLQWSFHNLVVQTAQSPGVLWFQQVPRQQNFPIGFLPILSLPFPLRSEQAEEELGARGEPCRAGSSLVLTLFLPFPCQRCCSSPPRGTRGKGCAPLTFTSPTGLHEADGWGNPLMKLAG